MIAKINETSDALEILYPSETLSDNLPSMLRVLKEKPNEDTFSKEHPLLTTLKHKDAVTALKLAELGAKTTVSCDFTHETALMLAAQINDPTQKDALKKLVSLLIKNEENINTTDCYGRTALMFAAERGASETVKELLAAGADASICTKYNETAVYLAALNNQTDALNVFIQADPTVLSAKFGTPEQTLVTALCAKNNAIGLEKALKAGADFEQSNAYGHVPAIVCAINNSARSLSVLLAADKTDVNDCDPTGKTAVIHAAENDNATIIKMLNNKQADLNKRDKFGQTALFYAIENDSIDAFHLLIALGADINLKNTNGETPLMFALKNKKIRFATQLIDADARVTTQNIIGNTAADYLAECLTGLQPSAETNALSKKFVRKEKAERALQQKRDKDSQRNKTTPTQFFLNIFRKKTDRKK